MSIIKTVRSMRADYQLVPKQKTDCKSFYLYHIFFFFFFFTLLPLVVQNYNNFRSLLFVIPFCSSIGKTHGKICLDREIQKHGI